MHELTLCKSILDMVTKHAIENGINKIASIYLELGELAAVDKSALLFCFPIAAQKTIAEKAQLEIIDISGVATQPRELMTRPKKGVNYVWDLWL